MLHFKSLSLLCFINHQCFWTADYEKSTELLFNTFFSFILLAIGYPVVYSYSVHLNTVSMHLPTIWLLFVHKKMIIFHNNFYMTFCILSGTCVSLHCTLILKSWSFSRWIYSFIFQINIHVTIVPYTCIKNINEIINSKFRYLN